MANFIGDIFSLNDVYDRQTIQVDSAVVEVQAQTGLTVTATSGTGTVATLTYAAQTVAPFPVGSIIAVFGVVPVAYCGTFRVRTCTTTQVTYLSTATGALTTGGTVLLVTESIIKDDLWSNENTHGWFGGGFNPAIVERIDFSNDSLTASFRTNLNVVRTILSATGNSNYGWFGGGSIPAPLTFYSTVDRIDFSNDSSTASVRGPLSSARYGLAATGNSNYGWFGGGGTPVSVSTVDRIDFSNDSSTASVRGPLSALRRNLSATGNSDYGWFGGGIATLNASTVDRIDFSNDSATVSVRGPLSTIRRGLAATGNSNYGWFGGGIPGPLSTVDRIDFSNDSSTASVRGPLSLARSNLSATGNSNYGWFGGGYIPVTSPSTVDRIDFSNDSATASVRGPLTGRNGLAATSGQAKSTSIQPLKGGNFGWWGGGNSSAGSLSTVDRINFSSDSSTASVRGPLSLARGNLAATGNSNYGWFGGGNAPTSISTVDRIDFSNDSSTASVRGPLSLGRSQLAATGNSNYGWFGGGFETSGSGSRIDRIDFSNDFANASIRGSLSASVYRSDSMGNSNYGWFIGRTTTRISRITFDNDFSTSIFRGLLNGSRYNLAATGNSNYGWFGGGFRSIPFALLSGVNRIEFANDNITPSVRGPLSLAKKDLRATGNSNYGWFSGGSSDSVPIIFYSLVDRIDFSNDSVTTSVRGSLIGERDTMAATSNTPVG